MDKMDDDVSKLFVEFHQTDLREDPEMFRLLSDYFTTSKAVSELCESLRECCLERVEHNECLLIDEALRGFEEEEKLGYGGLLDVSFKKAVQDLRTFNEFDSYFLRKIHVCQDELTRMLVTLEKMMNEIDKKLKRVRGRRRAMVVVLDYIRNLGKFVTSETTEALKREKTAMTSMKRGTMVALKEVEKISRLVSILKSVDRSIHDKAEFAVLQWLSVAVAKGWMEEERKRLKSTLVDLEKETGRCDGLVQFGRTVARERIVEFLSRGEKSFK